MIRNQRLLMLFWEGGGKEGRGGEDGGRRDIISFSIIHFYNTQNGSCYHSFPTLNYLLTLDVILVQQ